MARFDIHDIKQQASLFFREKVKNARLALTDVSRIQLLAEEATNTDPWGPETRTMAMLSEAAFELEEYERIVQVLKSRLVPNVKRPWRQLYKTLIVLEYLLTHGPRSLSVEFRTETACLEELCQYNFIDHQGIDRGINVRNKADCVLELLSKADVWKEERSRAQKISHGIRGFGSKVDKSPAANTKRVDNQQIELDFTQSEAPIDAERVSLLSSETSQEVSQPQGEWQPFEKCISMPSYLRYNDKISSFNNNSSSASNGYGQQKNGSTYISPFKKNLSSPGHFRDTSQMVGHTFAEDGNKENNSGSNKADLIPNSMNSILLQVPCDDEDGGLPYDEKSSMDPPKVLQLDNVTATSHLSMRRLFHLHKPAKDMAECGTTGNDATNKQPALLSAKDDILAPGATQTPYPSVSVRAKSVKTSNLPILPPLPRSKFRSKFQHHFKPSNLIDL